MNIDVPKDVGQWSLSWFYSGMGNWEATARISPATNPSKEYWGQAQTPETAFANAVMLMRVEAPTPAEGKGVEPPL